MIELYDLGRCTHRPVKGMYEFIIDNAARYVADGGLARELEEHAANREKPGYSIPQERFSEMCRIWVQAHRSGAFPFRGEELVFPDTAPRFAKVKQAGRNIGILTSGSGEFTRMLFDVRILGVDYTLAALVDEYLLGEEIGDKDHPETFTRLWESRKGDIAAIFDDKLSVCEAAVTGLSQAGGSSRIYLVDRKDKYSTGELAERVRQLQDQGVQRITNFGEVHD